MSNFLYASLFLPIFLEGQRKRESLLIKSSSIDKSIINYDQFIKFGQEQEIIVSWYELYNVCIKKHKYLKHYKHKQVKDDNYKKKKKKTNLNKKRGGGGGGGGWAYFDTTRL